MRHTSSRDIILIFFFNYLREIFIVHKSKEYKIKLKLASQSTTRFSSFQVWLISIYQSICNLLIRRVKIEILHLILELSITMWTKTFELFSIWRCIISYLRVISIHIYITPFQHTTRHKFQFVSHKWSYTFHYSSWRWGIHPNPKRLSLSIFSCND